MHTLAPNLLKRKCALHILHIFVRSSHNSKTYEKTVYVESFHTDKITLSQKDRRKIKILTSEYLSRRVSRRNVLHWLTVI